MEAKTFTLVLIAIPLLCYALASGFYFFGLGRIGLALCFFGYSVANIGLIMDLYER